MADLKSFQLYDSTTGAPLTSATPVFLDYRDRSGNAVVPQPTIVHVANGVYAFSPSDSDVALGIAWVVTSGAGAFPARYFGDVSDPTTPFFVGVFESGAGALVDISGTPPALAFYKDRSGNTLTPIPSPVDVNGGYLWSVTPNAADSVVGVVFDLVAPTGSYPAHFAGDLLAAEAGTTTVVLSRATTATTVEVAEPFVAPDTTSTASGIFQSDLCIQHGIVEGMNIIRSTPWLLDAVVRNITFDPLTSKRYGQKELDQLKNWFINTNIPVIPYRMGPPLAPSISLAMVSSNIMAETLGDIHHDDHEEISGTYTIAGPFNPTYNGFTGVMTLPAGSATDVFPGMEVVDSKGQAWTIGDIISNVDPISFELDTGILTNFRGATIRAPALSILESQESIKFKEAWSLGCHVHGEPGKLLFLHAILTFVLLWGKQTLFEARGFELGDFSSTDFSKNQAFEDENVYSRFVNLNGMTQSVWPKRRMSKILGVRGALKIIGGENMPAEAGDVNDLAWIGELDTLG